MTQYENWNLILRWSFQELSEANPEPRQTSKKELFVKIAFAAKNFKSVSDHFGTLCIKGLKLLTIFAKSSEDWYDSQYASVFTFSKFIHSTAWKVYKYRAFSVPYFPVFSPNIGKYGPEKTPYLDTFHAVFYSTFCMKHVYKP